MKANISIGECIIRVFVGMVFAAIMGGLFHNAIALLGIIAIYPLVTGLGGWDPIYALRSKYTNEESPYEPHHEHASVSPITRTIKNDVNSAA